MSTPETADLPGLKAALRHYFGYTVFKPLQEEIIREVLAQRDVLALLPTGGGKSLCYQLPALLLPGLTVVVSPLIALMKDQVDGLVTNGIEAAFLNSTLTGAETRQRIEALDAGRVRLLYVAPERLMMPEFLERLRDWRVSLFAVDEAHCISEWGHDFRPEYRQLARLRELFPDIHMSVFTATATHRVRQDILDQLKLRDPRIFAASFNRPNLIYRVVPKERGSHDQVLDLLRQRTGESGIVYCQSRQSTEDLAAFLNGSGIAARPYHAGLPAEERARSQEMFQRDDVQVICATIAFGMGVDKPNVRFVIHHDLPKNIESYYQETGRAGRDGLPSECVLLFGRGDVAKQMRFIESKPGEHEAELARRQLWKMVEYAEAHGCRRIGLLNYFGEAYREANCQACDECLTPRHRYDGTVLAQKYMSCIWRIKQNSPSFGPGMRYIADVLRGETSDAILKWSHDKLSTFGIGKDLSLDAWMHLARQLAQLGFLRQTQDGKYPRVELTPEGQRALVSRQPILLTQPDKADEPDENAAASRKSGKPKRRAARGEIECDEGLFERLRKLRKTLADEREVPAYIVFSDATLREMARLYPETDNEFASISGVGDKKRQEFAKPFLAEILDYLSDHDPQTFSDLPAKVLPKRLGNTAKASLKLHDAGMSISEIAKERNLTEGTIWDHLLEAAQAGEKLDLKRFVTSGQKLEIAVAFGECESGSLTEVFEKLQKQYSYGLLKLFRALGR